MYTELLVLSFSVAFLSLLIVNVSFCFKTRFEKNHSWLPGHGCRCPPVWLHCGHSQFLLGRKPNPACGRTAVPHDRYVAHLVPPLPAKVKAALLVLLPAVKKATRRSFDVAG